MLHLFAMPLRCSIMLDGDPVAAAIGILTSPDGAPSHVICIDADGQMRTLSTRDVLFTRTRQSPSRFELLPAMSIGTLDVA